MSDLNRLLPIGALPATHFPPNTIVDYCDIDTRDTRQAGAGDGGHDIEYAFNGSGYRCAEFEESADMRLLVIGCSYVMGIGLPQSHLFHERFAERLRRETSRTVIVWNLAIPGASNDYISRLLFLGVPYLDPDLVLINFTHVGRREYVSVQNRPVPYTPNFRPSDFVDREICKHFDALSSPFDDRLNLFKNYKAIEALLADRCWLFSTIEPLPLTDIGGHVQMERYVGNMPGLDHARDGAHPGPRSHEALMEAYWRRFAALDVPLPRTRRR